jgi:LmeA-like phospholipid-binding
MSYESDRPSSKLISKALSPAVRLWLRSQVESIEELDFRIEGGDRQILSGCIPKVAIVARKALYQGLHLSQVDLTGEMIRINLGQVLKGKALKLLDAVPIYGVLSWDEADLNASLKAPLLKNALAEFVLPWLRSVTHLLSNGWVEALAKPWLLQDATAEIQADQVVLWLKWRGLRDDSPLLLSTTLRTGLSLGAENCLKLEQPQLVVSVAQESDSIGLPDYSIELGDVALQELGLELGRLWVQGQIKVLP